MDAICAEADPRRTGQVSYDFFVGMVRRRHILLLAACYSADTPLFAIPPLASAVGCLPVVSHSDATIELASLAAALFLTHLALRRRSKPSKTRIHTLFPLGTRRVGCGAGTWWPGPWGSRGGWVAVAGSMDGW